MARAIDWARYDQLKAQGHSVCQLEGAPHALYVWTFRAAAGGGGDARTMLISDV